MAGQRESGLVCDQQRNWDLGLSWSSWSSCREGLHCRSLCLVVLVLASCRAVPAVCCARRDERILWER